MVMIGRRALRNIAFAKDVNNLLRSGQLLYGADVGDNIQLEMLKEIHKLPAQAKETDPPPVSMLTGMLTFNPNISVFEPGDEDVGRFANAYGQTITSRSSDVTFSTDGAVYEDLVEMGESIAKALAMPATPAANYPELAASGTFKPGAAKRTHIRPDLDVKDDEGQQFQLYRLMWEEGLSRMYVMPGLILGTIQLNATLRQAVRMSSQFTGADIIDVSKVRDLFDPDNAKVDVLSNYFQPTNETAKSGYPWTILPDNTDISTAKDEGVASYRAATGGVEQAVRAIKSRFTAQTIEVYINPEGGSQEDVSSFKIDSDLVGAQVTISTGLMPSWRFGNLGFSTVVRTRRGITFQLTFLNTSRGRRQFQEFLRPEREVQTIWMVFYNTARTKRMIIKGNIRISGVGQLPGDDGQGANTTQLNYRTVGVDENNNIMGLDQSDYELIFDDNGAVSF